jgi:hypothetical protein
MELLMVIGIILLLIGLLIPAISIAQTQAKRAKCLAFINEIKAGCDIYRNLMGTYPDDPVIAQVFTGGATPPAPVAVTTITAAQWLQVSQELLSMLQRVDRERFATMTALNDPWGQTLRYRPSQYYPYSQTPGTSPTTNLPYVIDSQNPPNPDSFQMWSCAQNLRDEEGQVGTDDIVSWSR